MKRALALITLLIGSFFLLISQIPDTINSGTFVDERDGHEYKWIEINDQTWMAENVSYQPASGNYWPADNESYVETYGYLYDWRTALKVCPSGWHLPHRAEWRELNNYLARNAGGKLKEAGTSHWKAPNNNATNEYGFSALPGGMAVSDMVIAVGIEGSWWTCTFTIEDNITSAYFWKMTYDSGILWMDDIVEGLGFSVRCVEDF